MMYDFGLVGLGVMGRNFIMNVAGSGYSTYGLDTDKNKVASLKKDGEGRQIEGTTNMEIFVSCLSRPRKIMLLVPAGEVVDEVIKNLSPLLDRGDLIIDGGNSYFQDTERRVKYLKEKSIDFIGAGVSGGAKGARFGPSIMPGGSRKAYENVKHIFESIAAKVDGEPCVEYLGNGSAGNYVKMIHNGIEYGMMQVISEGYDIMKRGLNMSNDEISNTFLKWNEGRLHSFLIEITAGIFAKRDDLGSGYLIDQILDKAKQKGTGKWTSQNAMDLGTAVPTIDAAVSMREVSALKSQREEARSIYGRKGVEAPTLNVEQLETALYIAFIVTYAQGMTQLSYASKEYNYELNMATVAKIWRGGCIIRSSILDDMRKAYESNPMLESLFFDEDFASGIKGGLEGIKKTVRFAVGANIPIMAISASLNYFQAYTTDFLPLNLIQAQRDCFGSHTYERTDRKGVFHTDW